MLNIFDGGYFAVSVIKQITVMYLYFMYIVQNLLFTLTTVICVFFAFHLQNCY